MISAPQMKNRDAKGQIFRNSQHALMGPKEDNSQIGSQLSSSFTLFLLLLNAKHSAVLSSHIFEMLIWALDFSFKEKKLAVK